MDGGASQRAAPSPVFSCGIHGAEGDLGFCAREQKKVVYEILFSSVSETLREVSERRLEAEIGFLAVLHTWSQVLLHHPHVHCVIPGGGLSADGDRWLSSRPKFLLPVKILGYIF